MSDKLKPGTRVNRHVRLVRPLTSGAMGSLWVGEHVNLDTLVAVKFIAEDARFENPDSARRFEVEAKATAQIRSPHVVQIFDHGVSEAGVPYIVMELLEGESLADRLERTGWLSFAQAADVIRQLGAALGKAHEAAIIHRDIKPDNVFLCKADDSFFVKLLDFGVAKSLKAMETGVTSPGAMVGTAEYLSREQVVSAKAVDEQADLWSLAVVAYEMLTGDVPFTGETLGLICIAICNGVFTPPSELRKGVPPAVDAWFERAFQPSPADRFPTARAMADAFVEALRASDDALAPEVRRSSMVGDVALARRSQLPALGIDADAIGEALDDGEAPPSRRAGRSRASRPMATAVGIGPPSSVPDPSGPPPASAPTPESDPIDPIQLSDPDARASDPSRLSDPDARASDPSRLSDPDGRAGVPVPGDPDVRASILMPDDREGRVSIPMPSDPDATRWGDPDARTSVPMPANGPDARASVPMSPRESGAPRDGEPLAAARISAAGSPHAEAPPDEGTIVVPLERRRGRTLWVVTALAALVVGVWLFLRREVQPLNPLDIELPVPLSSVAPPVAEPVEDPAEPSSTEPPAVAPVVSKTPEPIPTPAAEPPPAAPEKERFDARSDYGF